MKRFLGIVATVFVYSSSGYAQDFNFVAECWVRCDLVQARTNGGDFPAFRRHCEQNFAGRIYQDDRGQLVCATDESRIAADSIPGYAENCPAVTPIELKRWFARCGEAGQVIRYGWQIGDCVTRRNLRPENIRCQ